MSSMRRRGASWLTCAVGVALATGPLACAAGGATNRSDDDAASAGSTGGAGGDDSSATGVGGGLAVATSGSGGGAPVFAEVYGHGPNQLYKLDPQTKAVTTIGSFDGCSSLIDLAIDKDNNLYGTTSKRLVRIDKDTAACTQVADGDYPNSLSFVPEGTVDPNVEALVGYYEDRYVRVDTVTGDVSDIGLLGGGYRSSGDIVSVIDGGTYLTVTGNGCGDCLVEVDPATGALVKNWGPLGHNQVFGLAFWGGVAYGFSNSGALFEIIFGDTTVTTVAIPIPGAPSNLQFWGAGSATSAPIAPPQ